jgi:ABC-type glutathione transport system ATPase component
VAANGPGLPWRDASTKSELNWLNVFSPDILILDDPTSSLDTKVTDQIFSYVTREAPWSEKTFVVSTNNIKTFDYADKIIIIKKGKIMFFGTYDQMMENPDLANMINELKKAKGENPESAANDNKPEKVKFPYNPKKERRTSQKAGKGRRAKTREKGQKAGFLLQRGYPNRRHFLRRHGASDRRPRRTNLVPLLLPRRALRAHVRLLSHPDHFD